MLSAAAVLSDIDMAGAAQLHRLALQLYSVRDDMNRDARGTLKALAGLGYTHVEHANYSSGKFYGIEVKEFKKLLDDLGLKMPSGHTTMARQHWDAAKNDFTDEWKRTIEDAAAVGQRFVLSPSLYGADLNEAGMKPYMEQFNKCGELCKKYNMKFGYHNHEFEYTTMIGQTPLFDYMLQNTDPSLVTWQLDIGNMYIAGADALNYIDKYPGRFELLHVKDMIKHSTDADGKQKFESCQLGKGLLPLKQILKAAKNKGGTAWFVIEQEEYQGLGQTESVGIDLKLMKKWGY